MLLHWYSWMHLQKAEWSGENTQQFSHTETEKRGTLYHSQFFYSSNSFKVLNIYEFSIIYDCILWMTQTFPGNMKNQDGLMGKRRYPSSTRMTCSFLLQMVQWYLDTCQLLFGNKRASKYKLSFMSTSVHLLIPLPLARTGPKPSRKPFSDLSFTNAGKSNHRFHKTGMFGSWKSHWHVPWWPGKDVSFSSKTTLGSFKQIQYMYLLQNFG